jgi:arylsulfatase
MKSKAIRPALTAIGGAAIMAAIPAMSADTIHGVPGSPSATRTIYGTQLPAPDTKFGGVIQETAAQSKPYWPPRTVLPRARSRALV